MTIEVELKSAATLKMRCVIPAAPDWVYRAWIEPALMAQWYAPNPALRIEAVTDPRPGGTWTVRMIPSDGAPFIVAGRYQTAEPPVRLMFSWQWQSEDETEITRVAVALASRGDGATLMRVTHDQFVDPDEVESHTWGWTHCFERLIAAAEGEHGRL